MDEHPDIHLHGPSYWPILTAGGLLLIAVGTVSNILISLAGILVLLASIAGWAAENRREESHYE